MRLHRFIESVNQAEITAFADTVRERYGLEDFSLSLYGNGDLKLIMIAVPKGERSAGRGSAAIEALCRFADSNGLRIILSPAQKDSNWGTTSQNRLIKFYSRFGFVRNRGRNKDYRISDMMFRVPRSRGALRDMSESEGIDLKSLYTEYNQKYFDGQLPDIPIGWSRLKSVSGVAYAKVKRTAPKSRKNPNTGAVLVPGSLSISIDNTFARSRENIEGILLHEMVHIYLYVTGIFYPTGGSHGLEFMRSLRELERKTGRRLPITDSTKDMELSANVADKPVTIVVRWIDGKLRSFALISPKTVQPLVAAFSNARPDSSNRYLIATISSPEWTKLSLQIPIQRPNPATLWKMKWILADRFQEQLGQLEQGKILFDNR